MSDNLIPDCFSSLFGDDEKLGCLTLDKQQQQLQRNRQRVDAGEPRNSYSSIPNFSSRSSLMSSGLYGAIFSQQSQNFGGLFPGNYAPAKMLNELLGRQVKQAQDAANSDSPIENNNGEKMDNEQAHHMLRNILQGKKELMEEMHQNSSPDSNQNTKILNNNNLMNNNNIISDSVSTAEAAVVSEVNSDKENTVNGEHSELLNGDSKKEEISEIIDDDMISNSSNSNNSSDVKMKEEMMDGDLEKEISRSPSPKSEHGAAMDLKRARVENIVSTIGGSTNSQQPQVNGCKKRKLYHPQQHDNSAERYNMNLNLHNLMLNEEEEDDDQFHQKRTEKNVLKSQLRSMQEQLAEMQQKYVQLCNRMEQQSESTDDVDDGTSDLVDDDLLRDNEKRKEKTPVNHMLNQMMSKMMSARPMPFNVLQHMQQQQNNEIQGFSNAAAMYLSQKLLMEQEARMQKEAEDRMIQQKQMQEKQKAEMMAAREQQMPKPSPPQPIPSNQQVKMPTEMSERLSMMRVNPTVPVSELEGLAEVLKTEINSSLSSLVDSIVGRFLHQRRMMTKQSEAAAHAAAELNKDLMMASQILDRKSPRTKSANDRAPNIQSGNVVTNTNHHHMAAQSAMPHHPSMINSIGPGPVNPNNGLQQRPPTFVQAQQPPPQLPSDPNSLNSLTQMNPMNLPTHVRPSPSAGMFQGAPKPQGVNSVAAAALYNAMNGGNVGNPFCMPEPPREQTNEQNEALSLVVTPKKKRHKVTDTRITPRTVSRILAQDALAAAQQNHLENQQQQQQNQIQQQQQQQQSNGNMVNGNMQNGKPQQGFNMPSSIPSEQPSPRGNFHHSALPVSLPTSVAIPNPSLHESQVFSPYSPFFNPHGPHGPQNSSMHHMHMSSSPPGMGGMMDPRDSPPLPHPPTMLHPALLAAAHHGNSPDYGHIRAAMEANDRNSDCNSADISYDGMQQSMSFSNAFLKQLKWVETLITFFEEFKNFMLNIVKNLIEIRGKKLFNFKNGLQNSNDNKIYFWIQCKSKWFDFNLFI